jgi:pimeloyl-ACP methyl ester carboxylesterase
MRTTDPKRSQLGALAFGALTLLSVGAWVTRRKTRQVEAQHPPTGHFIDVDGVRLHYTERGPTSAPTVVLLHGNGAMTTEMELSGLVAQLAARYRVIVFDRPGYGYSERPSGRSFTPPAQAALFHDALMRLGVREAIALGHSWGAMVATAMALADPAFVRGVMLVSGYYTPSLRLDVTWMSPPALPLVGTLMRHTVSPLLARLLWPAMMRRIFAPAPTAPAFAQGYPVWMSLRPGTLRASAAEAAMMIPQAIHLLRQESNLRVPVAIVAGQKDRLVSTAWHSSRLHRRLPGSRLHVVPNAGHMVHHTAPDAVAAALDELVARAWPKGLSESAQAVPEDFHQATHPHPRPVT